MTSNPNREDWLQQAVIELRPIFEANGFPLPDRIRVTCGFPSSKARSLHRAIGEHWSPSASSDNTHEILISPVVDDATEAFAILCHELAHAATNGDGHRGRFPECVRKLWLEGKPTATVAGDTFKINFAPVIDSLGNYPHSRLNINAERKVQGTRMLKAVCPACGYTIRLTSKWSQLGLPYCANNHSATQFLSA